MQCASYDICVNIDSKGTEGHCTDREGSASSAVRGLGNTRAGYEMLLIIVLKFWLVDTSCFN